MLGADEYINTSNKELMDKMKKEEIGIIVNTALIGDLSPYT